MSAFVIDTNVPVVANGRAEQAGAGCVLACLQALEEVYASGIVILDEGGLVLDEYMNNLNMSGQPGAGDFFFKWVWQNQAVPQRCERVTITPRQDDPSDFEEFPRDPRLAGFDRADRKFVALAIASSLEPTVLNAVDSDWWDFGAALAENGARVRNLCPEQERAGTR
ncbi:MAG: hypothetical protein PVJ57_17910 [Phycisphaerae bacterium]|jgi:hypothetical protein